MALDYPALLAELRAEGDALITVLTDLDPDHWLEPTPAEGWSVLDSVTHLAYFDDCARTAMVDGDAFRAQAKGLAALGPDFPDRVMERFHDTTPELALDWFTSARGALLRTFTESEPKARLPWFGPDMSVASSATARLMETYAHGRDVYDTVGITPAPSAGLRSIAHLGVSTLGFAHVINGQQPPTEPVHVALAAPDGAEWTWGPADAPNSVRGPAEDFVLAVTQRRNRSDLALTVTGPVAEAWMGIAQIYAGEPGPGRAPSSPPGGLS